MAKIGEIKEMIRALGAWDTFRKNHPKFPEFIEAAREAGVQEGTILTFTVETPEGKKIESNLEVKESDLDFLKLTRYLN